jgi:hypothetical protein
MHGEIKEKANKMQEGFLSWPQNDISEAWEVGGGGGERKTERDRMGVRE